jgi:hypothetical protein
MDPRDPKRDMDDPVNIDMDFDEALAALLDDEQDEDEDEPETGE